MGADGCPCAFLRKGRFVEGGGGTMPIRASTKNFRQILCNPQKLMGIVVK